MNVSWTGTGAAHEAAIQAEMLQTIKDLQALGAHAAHAACEARRVWLVGQVSAPWLSSEYGLHTGVLTPSQASSELATPFVPFALPEQLTVAFVPPPIHGLAPNCPMGTWVAGNRIEVVAANISPQLTALNLSVRQLTLHELIHVMGDAAGDNAPRMNWAGVGALVRKITRRPVDVHDRAPAAG